MYVATILPPWVLTPGRRDETFSTLRSWAESARECFESPFLMAAVHERFATDAGFKELGIKPITVEDHIKWVQSEPKQEYSEVELRTSFGCEALMVIRLIRTATIVAGPTMSDLATLLLLTSYRVQMKHDDTETVLEALRTADCVVVPMVDKLRGGRRPVIVRNSTQSRGLMIVDTEMAHLDHHVPETVIPVWGCASFDCTVAPVRVWGSVPVMLCQGKTTSALLDATTTGTVGKWAGSALVGVAPGWFMGAEKQKIKVAALVSPATSWSTEES